MGVAYVKERSQSGFEFAGIDEGAQPRRGLGSKTRVAVAAHRTPPDSGSESFAEANVEVNAVRAFRGGFANPRQ